MKWSLGKNKNTATSHGGLGKGLFGQGMNPVRDWLIGLLAATIVFLGGAALIAYDFHVQFVLPPEATNTSDISVKYSERDVEYYADRFREKDAHFKELRGNPALIVPEASTASPENEDDSLAEDASGEYTTPALSP